MSILFISSLQVQVHQPKATYSAGADVVFPADNYSIIAGGIFLGVVDEWSALGGWLLSLGCTALLKLLVTPEVLTAQNNWRECNSWLVNAFLFTKKECFIVEEPIQLVSWLAMDDCKMHSRTVEYIVRDDIEF